MSTVNPGDVIDPRVKSLLASGSVIKSSFYNNLSATSQGGKFRTGVSTATGYNSIGSLLTNAINIVDGILPSTTSGLKRDVSFNSQVTNELSRVATSMASFGKIPYDSAYKFLLILICVDNISDMTKIADAVQLPELANESILNQPLEILAIRKLPEVAFFADAVYGVIAAYDKYTQSITHHQGQDTNFNSSLSDIINEITGAVGVLNSILGFGGALGGSPNSTAASSTTMLGNQLTKLVLGKEIPIAIQANNPAMMSPSVTGKMMFGEAPTGTSLIDMNQLFAKPIAVYGEVNGGAGNLSFAMKNTGSLNTPQSLNDLIKKVAFGGKTPASGSYASNLLSRMQDNASNILGANGTSFVEMTRADNAIPVMSALSDVMSGVSEKLPEINKQLRANLTKITESEDGINNLHKKGVTLAEATANGLNETSNSPSPLGINIDVVSVFPIDTFKQGWSDMNHSMQHLQKNSTDFNKIVTVLSKLG